MLIIVNNQPFKVISYTNDFIVANNDKYNETFKLDEIDVVCVENTNEIVPDVLINKSIFAVTEGNVNGEKYEYTRS
jgi:hypothetical protein